MANCDVVVYYATATEYKYVGFVWTVACSMFEILELFEDETHTQYKIGGKILIP